MAMYDYTGKKVLVRSADSGVHFGTVEWWGGAQAPHMIILTESRRLWEWETVGDGITLTEITVSGLNYKGSRISMMSQRIMIIGICEIIEASGVAAASIEGAPVSKPAK